MNEITINLNAHRDHENEPWTIVGQIQGREDISALIFEVNDPSEVEDILLSLLSDLVDMGDIKFTKGTEGSIVSIPMYDIQETRSFALA